jgi:TolA-binding protein
VNLQAVEFDFRGPVQSTGNKDYASEVAQRDLQEEIEYLRNKVQELRIQVQELHNNENLGANAWD